MVAGIEVVVATQLYKELILEILFHLRQINTTAIPFELDRIYAFLRHRENYSP